MSLKTDRWTIFRVEGQRVPPSRIGCLISMKSFLSVNFCMIERIIWILFLLFWWRQFTLRSLLLTQGRGFALFDEHFFWCHFSIDTSVVRTKCRIFRKHATHHWLFKATSFLVKLEVGLRITLHFGVVCWQLPGDTVQVELGGTIIHHHFELGPVAITRPLLHLIPISLSKRFLVFKVITPNLITY